MDEPASTLRFAIFASGRGSNALALMDAFENGFIPAKIVLVVVNVADAPIIAKARERGYEVAVVPNRGSSREAHEERILDAVERANVDHILLAGYMRVLSPPFLSRFRGAVINIHPSLLPDFRGLHGAERQWQAGRKVAGATVHMVVSDVDAGQILLQGSLEVHGDEGPEGLAQRILVEVEHVIYPRAVRLFIDRLREQPRENS